MLLTKAIYRTEVNGNEIDFSCPPTCPIDDALEGNAQHKAFLLGRKQMAEEAQKAQSPAPVQESKVEPMPEASDQKPE